MAPVHLYLAAWVLGGVLLGASMLLDARESETPEDGLSGPASDLTSGALGSAAKTALFGSHAEARASTAGSHGLSGAALASKDRGLFARYLRVLPLGLIGFGLSGLLAKGLDVDLWPWTFLFSLSMGFALIAVGYRLSRARPVDPTTPR
jgi:hypothetical protein